MPFACRSRHLALFFSVTGVLPQRNALLPRYISWRPRSCSFEGLAADVNIICSVVRCVPHPHSLGVVSRSLRLLAVLSGDEPEANVWHRILAWSCHRSIGGHTCGARLTAIDDGLRAAASARIREHAVRIGPSGYCGTGFVFFFFRFRNVGTVRSRSCSSPVFHGMWTSLVHLHLPLRSREVV